MILRKKEQFYAKFLMTRKYNDRFERLFQIIYIVLSYGSAYLTYKIAKNGF